MASKFVRKIIKADPRTLDINETEQGDLVHADNGNLWGHSNQKYVKLSPAVTRVVAWINDSTPNKDGFINFQNEDSTEGGLSTVGSLVMSGKGFEATNDGANKFYNKAINSVSGSASSTVGNGTDGSVYFERTDTTDGHTKTLGQLNFSSKDFVVTTADQNGNEVINVSKKPLGGPEFYGLTVDPIVTHGDLFWSIYNGNLVLDFEDVDITLHDSGSKVIGTIANIQVFKNFHFTVPVIVQTDKSLGAVTITIATTGEVSVQIASGSGLATKLFRIDTVQYVPAVKVNTAI